MCHPDSNAPNLLSNPALPLVASPFRLQSPSHGGINHASEVTQMTGERRHLFNSITEENYWVIFPVESLLPACHTWRPWSYSDLQPLVWPQFVPSRATLANFNSRGNNLLWFQTPPSSRIYDDLLAGCSLTFKRILQHLGIEKLKEKSYRISSESCF